MLLLDAGVLRGLHAVLVGAVDERDARAEGQGAHLHGVRRLGDAPLRVRACASTSATRSTTARRARRSSR